MKSGRSSEQILLDLIQETGAKTVVWTALYEPWILKRDQNIESTLKGFVQKNSTDPTPTVTFTGAWDGGDLDIAATGTYRYVVSNANYKPITFIVTVTA